MLAAKQAQLFLLIFNRVPTRFGFLMALHVRNTILP